MWSRKFSDEVWIGFGELVLDYSVPVQDEEVVKDLGRSFKLQPWTQALSTRTLLVPLIGEKGP